METETGLIVGEDGLARPPWATRSPLLRDYYDTEWGMPVRDDDAMFERLVLEGFQAGLSWETILAKRESFRRAFADFRIDTVAAFTENDVARLRADAAIIRNERKIRAAVSNAQAAVDLRADGGLAAFVWSFQPAETPAPRSVAEIPSRSRESEALAAALKQRGFAFVGPTSMFALLEAAGIIDTHIIGSHRRGSSGVWR